ncbi:putative membrane protein [Tamaricihabitans halophyticus]|uniref:Putative membrane protein n=1 Tax=Tamaricihabitans halophyticus TaxID=1262583 RepID=A0A4R2R3H9_9PSEU|nr:glycosyltransferase 87 family protein [Tamaricihabitans halophyticus]TCP57380.1 putative membrane protein [Tamaricihabitans halophyticus]
MSSEQPTEAAEPAVSLDEQDRVLPSKQEPLVRAASAPIGGPVGEHATIGRQWFWTPLRVGLLLCMLTLMLSWFGKASCIQEFTNAQGQAELDWRSERQYVAMCYSDVIPLYSAEKLDQGAFPYKTKWVETHDGVSQDRYMEYPVLTGLFQWVNAKLTDAWLSGAQAGWLPGALPVAIYFNITAFWLGLAWLATVWAVARSNPRRPWDAALVALSPLVLVHAFTNFDTIACALAAAAVLAWSRKRSYTAGLLLGLGAAAKLYPLFLLGPLLILCLRAGKLREFGRTAGTALATWIVVNLPIALLYPAGWREFFRLNAERPADPDSIYNVISGLTGWAGFDGELGTGESPVLLNTISAVLFLACCAAIGFIGLSAPTRPRLAQLGFLVLAAFLLTNKVWSPQYSLWLVPLAVLALPRWRILLGWMLLDALVWVPRMMMYLGVDNKGLPAEWFLSTVLVRDLAVVGLCALIVYEIYRPTEDLLRARTEDRWIGRHSRAAAAPSDPTGGVLDGAPDAFRLDLRRVRSTG